jgi:hypothetical protein
VLPETKLTLVVKVFLEESLMVLEDVEVESLFRGFFPIGQVAS